VAIGIPGYSQYLSVSTTTASTKNNTLDDGSGNLTVAGTGAFNGQLWASGAITAFPTNKVTTTVGSYQGYSVVWGTSSTGSNGPLKLISSGLTTAHDSGGAVQTTLDDGSGNMHVAGQLTVQDNSGTGGAGVELRVINTFPSVQGYTGGFASAAVGPLMLQPFGGALRTSTSTLDDGSGNMLVAGRGAFAGSTSSPAVGAAVVGYTTLGSPAPSVLGGVIDCKTANGAATSPLQLQLSGGAVYTSRSILDDANGNMSINPSSGGVSKLSLFGDITNATGFFYGFGAASTQLQYNSQNNHAWYSQASATGARVNPMILYSTGQLGLSSTTTGTTMSSLLNVGTAATQTTGTSTIATFTQGYLGAGNSVGIQLGQNAATTGELLYTFTSGNNGVMRIGCANPNQVIATGKYLSVSTGGTITTPNSTLDDGSGNIAATVSALATNNAVISSFYSGMSNSTAVYLQLGQSQATNKCAAYGFGYNTTTASSSSAFMAVYGSGKNLAINGAGVVSTPNNTLDDGSGNMTITSTNSVLPLIIQSSGTNGVYIALEQGTADKVNLGWSSSSGCYISDGNNTSPWLWQGGTTTGAVRTVNNVLDNGSGNMTVSSKLTAATAKVGTQALTTGIYSGTATSFTTGNSNFPLSLVYSGAGSSWSTPVTGNVVNIPIGAWQVSMVFIFTLTSPYYITFNLGSSGLGASNFPTSFQIPVSSSGYPFNFQFFIQATSASATMTFTCGAGGSYTLSYSQITFTPAP
jgi:hypothetical protein